LLPFPGDRGSFDVVIENQDPLNSNEAILFTFSTEEEIEDLVEGFRKIPLNRSLPANNITSPTAAEANISKSTLPREIKLQNEKQLQLVMDGFDLRNALLVALKPGEVFLIALTLRGY
jgi:hypothetical protein